MTRWQEGSGNEAKFRKFSLSVSQSFFSWVVRRSGDARKFYSTKHWHESCLLLVLYFHLPTHSPHESIALPSKSIAIICTYSRFDFGPTTRELAPWEKIVWPWWGNFGRSCCWWGCGRSLLALSTPMTIDFSSIQDPLPDLFVSKSSFAKRLQGKSEAAWNIAQVQSGWRFQCRQEFHDSEGLTSVDCLLA